MFDKILEAYQKKDEALFAARVRNWLDAELPCPFEPGSPEHGLYAKAVMAHKRWRGKGISSRYAKVQMIDFVRQIAEMQKDKQKAVETSDNAVGETPVETSVETPVVVNEVKLEEPIHMTGVVPEKIHFFKKKVDKNENKQTD